jgi:cyclic lactone autoinducer peptide
MSYKIKKKLAESVERFARKNAGQRCMFAWHQPKVPQALRKTK